MNNKYHSRKQKVELLTDILNGRKTLSDLQGEGTMKITVWHPLGYGTWRDYEGNIKNEADIGAKESSNRMNVIIVLPKNDDD